MERKDLRLLTAVRFDVDIDDAFLTGTVLNSESVKVLAEVVAKMQSDRGTKYYLVYAEMSNILGYVKAEYVVFQPSLLPPATLGTSSLPSADLGPPPKRGPPWSTNINPTTDPVHSILKKRVLPGSSEGGEESEEYSSDDPSEESDNSAPSLSDSV